MMDDVRGGAAALSDRQGALTPPRTGLAEPPPVGDFVALLKPRVMSLVVFTAVTGLVLAPGSLHPVLAAIAVLCIAIGAGAAGAINMWYERDIDALMARTRARPLPAGRMDPGTALGFGVMLCVGSVSVMALAVNGTAAALLSLTIAFYVFVYTIWLKRRTPQNIVIGGAAGAFPPMIGWAAVTGDIGLGGVALFRIDLHVDAAAFLGAVALQERATTRRPESRCCRWLRACARPSVRSCSMRCAWRRFRSHPG